MPQPLPRAFRRQLQAEDAEKVDRIVREAGKLEAQSATGATAAGDERKLRGIPAIGRGVSGAIPGTSPGRSLL